MDTIQDYELEAAIIGRLIMIKDEALLVADKLKPEHFYDPVHNMTYQAIIDCMTSGSVDMAGIRYRLSQKGVRENSRLMEMCQMADNLREVENATDRLIKIWQAREMEELAKAILSRKVDELLGFTQDKLYTIASEGQTTTVDITSATMQATEDLEQRMTAFRNNERLPNTIYFGLDELDSRTLGMKGGELIILAGRPGMGKSSLKRTIAVNVARDKYPVKIFSKEMIPKEIANLMICSEAEVNSMNVRGGSVSDSEHNQYLKGSGKVANLDIEFDIVSSLTNFMVSVKKWRMKTDMTKPAVVFVDYLQQMSAKSKGNNKHLEIAAITDAMKQMAISQNLVIVALAQLSRAVESRGGDKRPILSDLRESGNIEQDADGVIFIYRPEYYGFETDEDGNSTEYLAELDVAKFRGGVPGVAKAQFIGQYGKFKSWNESMQAQAPAFTNLDDIKVNDVPF